MLQVHCYLLFILARYFAFISLFWNWSPILYPLKNGWYAVQILLSENIGKQEFMVGVDKCYCKKCYSRLR